MKCKSYDLFFEVIASKIRLDIMELLMKRSMSVGEICDSLGEEQSKVSHNLRKLSDCSFLDVNRDGKKRIYSLNKDTIVPLMRLVERHVSKYCGEECRVRA